MKKFILLLCALLMLVVVSNKYKEDYYVIPNESIRIRIIPNSNNIKDQILKKQVKSNMELVLANDLKDSKTIEESRSIIKDNLSNYQKEVKSVIKENGSDTNFNIDYGKHYFPEKKYKGVKYKAGFYLFFLITLGKGEGDNWWCVLFPPICLLETEDNNTSNAQYTSYVKEIFTKYLK